MALKPFGQHQGAIEGFQQGTDSQIHGCPVTFADQLAESGGDQTTGTLRDGVGWRGQWLQERTG